jgi:hypothetical protein
MIKVIEEKFLPDRNHAERVITAGCGAKRASRHQCGNELLALSICHENFAVRFTLAKGVSPTMSCGRRLAAKGAANEIS